MERNKKRKVLFLGNGILRAFSKESVSWDDLIESYTVNDKFKDLDKDLLQRTPFPLKAVLRTDDHVDELCEKISSSMKAPFASRELSDFIKELAFLGFDDIITTNYGYEFECALCGKENLSEKEVKKLQKHTDAIDKCNEKYALHTYYECDVGNEKRVRIWHIHGEARKKSSIVIGHYYYGCLLSRYQKYFGEKKNGYANDIKNEIETKYMSWLDLFILGDVYILGFGFDLSEFDLWWLINRKKREIADHGKTIFYEQEGTDTIKHLLLESYGCEHRSLGYANMTNEDYKKFYLEAIDNIKSDMTQKAPILI